MKGRQFSFAFTGREVLKASSNSSRRPDRPRIWRHEFWFANEISTLSGISHSAISAGPSLFSAAFTTSSNYMDYSLSPTPFVPYSLFPFILIPFFLDLFAFFLFFFRVVVIDLRFLFSCWSGTFAENAAQKRGTCGMKFANGLNSNYPGISFARFLRSTFFFLLFTFAAFTKSRSSFVMHYRILQKRRILGKGRK